MPAILKTTQIIEPSSATTNITLDSNGNVGINNSTPSAPGGAKNLVVDSTGITIVKSTTSNTTTGSARFDLATGTGNSYAIIGLNDNTGSPYWQLAAGSAVTGAYYDMPQHIFRNVAGTERMRINASGYITAPYQPAFFVGGGQSTITTTAGSVLPFTSASLDRTSSYNTSTYRFTAPVAGVYVFHSEIYTQNGGTYVSFCWRRNGSQLAIGAPNWSTGDNMINYRGTMSFADFTQASTIMINLALNDYIDIAVRNGANSVQWYPNHSWIMGYLIG